MRDGGGHPTVAIIGAGRMGQGLAFALRERGRDALMFGKDWTPQDVGAASLLLIAVPDDQITPIAGELAARAAVASTQVVLHLSGLLDRRALAPLGDTAAGLGSFHPLQSIADPVRAPEALAGAYAGIEGDERAIAAAEEFAIFLGMTPVRIPPAFKPVYHAAAAIASNFTVTLLATAERLIKRAGIPDDAAAKLYLPLLRTTVANIAATGPAAALTGPIRRGDVATVRAHLEALPTDDRALYRELARATLKLATEAGLDREKSRALTKLLDDPA